MPNIPTNSTTTSKQSTTGQVKSSRFNLGKMREAASQYSAGGGFQGKEELIIVPVYCPPPSSEFIRIRDDDDYWVECMTLDYAPENGRRGNVFHRYRVVERLAARGPERG
jgi:hypothetical protein